MSFFDLWVGHEVEFCWFAFWNMPHCAIIFPAYSPELGKMRELPLWLGPINSLLCLLQSRCFQSLSRTTYLFPYRGNRGKGRSNHRMGL